MFAVVHVCDCRMSASGSFSVIFRFRVCWIINFSVQPDCTAKQKKKTCYYILFSHENVGYRRVSVRALTFFAVLYWLNCRLLCAAYIVVFHFVVFLSLAPNFTADRLSLFHESQVRLVSFAFFFYSEGNCYTYFFFGWLWCNINVKCWLVQAHMRHASAFFTGWFVVVACDERK